MSLLERYTQPAESQLPTVSHMGEIPSGQPTCSIWIDGKEVTAIPGEAILRAAQRAGFEVPTLCDDEKLAPAAACRMCLVEIEGYHRPMPSRSEEHTSELQSRFDLVCRLLLEKKKQND